MTRVKYPRTPHLPWSPGASDDDVGLDHTRALEGLEVVVTEKLDGENTTLYADGLHARSVDSAHHPSRTWIKRLHGRIAHEIPDGWRICGENLAARHSIAYDRLLSYFYAFSVWDGDHALSWDDTVAFAHRLGIPTVPVLYRGPYDRKWLHRYKVDPARQEGYVVRPTRAFTRSEFGTHVGKWVRPGHVQTDTHWMFAAITPNGLDPQATFWSIRSGDTVDHEALDELIGGTASPVDLPTFGDSRLAVVLAGRLQKRERGVLLPELAQRFPLDLARSIADLVGLAPLLRRDIPDDARPTGLRSLARCVPLDALHAVAGTHLERVSWSRLVAEDAGLLGDPCDPIRAAFADLDPDIRDFRTHRALDRWIAGRVHSAEEAVAATWDAKPTGVLTLLIGPSGCGKSTIAATLPGVISLDAIRETSDDALPRGLQRLRDQRGQGTWDATSLTRSQRDLPTRIAREQGCLVQTLGVLTPKPVATARNQARRRTVPASVVERQWARVQWPYANEAERVGWRIDAHE